MNSSLNVNEMEKGSCSKKKVQSKTKQKYPDFFKVYISKFNSRKMPIPEAFTVYMNNLVPMKAMLRCNGRVWEVQMVRTGGNVVFQEGWEGFAKSNTLQIGDFLVFSYVGDRIFEVVIFGSSKCVKEEAGDKKLPEVNEEQDDDDDDMDYVPSVGLNGEQEEVEEEHEDCVVLDGSEEQDDDREGKDYLPSDGVDGEEEVLEENYYVIRDEDAYENMKKVMEEAGHNDHDKVDDDDQNENNSTWLWARRYLSDERNPFFFTKFRPRNHRDLHVPTRVIRDFNLEFPSEVSIFGPSGKEWKGSVKKWNDGRTWIRGWLQFCRWNGITSHDICICEILEGAKCIRVSIARDRAVN